MWDVLAPAVPRTCRDEWFREGINFAFVWFGLTSQNWFSVPPHKDSMYVFLKTHHHDVTHTLNRSTDARMAVDWRDTIRVAQLVTETVVMQ